MTALTIACNRGGAPLALVPMQHAVAHLAAQTITGDNGWYAMYSDEDKLFRSTSGLTIPAPLVVVSPSKKNYLDVTQQGDRVTRRVLFARDRWTCQYCGETADQRTAHKFLTVDHVKPAHLFPSRAAATTWDNVVAACEPCNRRKGGKLPRDVRNSDGKPMLPLNDPKQPSFVQLRFSGRLNPVQRDYINDYLHLRGSENEI